jgi:hypothetical protein
MKLKNAKFAKDMRPLDENCTCRVCQQHTRSYLHHAIKAQGVAAPAILITYHNVAYMQVCGGRGGQHCSKALSVVGVVVHRSTAAKQQDARPCVTMSVWPEL